MKTHPYGFRIVGGCNEERRLVDASAAFRAYAACDERAQVERESYLSAFQFGEEFRDFLDSSGSVRGYDGVCWGPWLWLDIDRTNDLDAALADGRRLALFLVERYQLDDDALLCFYSGSKGFHIGLPTALWLPEPSANFNRICRRLAERIAEMVGIRIDSSVFDKVRPFRAPNSKHPKTGLHKRRLALDELEGLSLDGIRKLAEKPAPFDLPSKTPICEQAKADWLAAVHAATQSEYKKSQRAPNEGPTLNRSTLDFIREGAIEGDRHRLLYSSAANLAEFGCPAPLAHALLTQAALDSGLPPGEVRRQIECGLARSPGPSLTSSNGTPPPPSGGSMAEGKNLPIDLAGFWSSSIQTPSPAMPSSEAAVENLPAIVTNAMNIMGAKIVHQDPGFGVAESEKGGSA